MTFNGGGGNDRLTWADFTSTQPLFTYNGGAGADTLVGPNIANTWSITGPGAGTLNSASLKFAAVENLTGNESDDLFKFSAGAKVTGAITAGGGNNVLDFSAWTAATSTNLQTGKSSGAGKLIGTFNTVIGGSGKDQLTAGPNGALLIGNAGTDTLKGGAGRDILIGGSGADTVDGGAADDILIGSLTTYINESTKSANLTALRAILNEWTRADAEFQLRILHLVFGTAYLNGPHLLTDLTVVDDSPSKDKLYGRAGLDWFYAHPLDSSVDWDPNAEMLPFVLSDL